MQTLAPVYAALSRGDWAAARAQCGDILQDGEDVAPVHHAIGLSYCGEGRFAEAVPSFAEARRLDPENADWSRDLGILYGHFTRWPDIVDVLAPFLESLDTEALALYLTAATEMKCAAEALDRLTRERQAALPTDPQFLCAQALALTGARRFEEAEATFQACLLREPDKFAAHEGLAIVCKELKQDDRALHHARECVRLQPESGHARIRLALACRERGLGEESRRERLTAESLGLSRHERSVSLYLSLFESESTGDSLVRAARKLFAGTAAITGREGDRRPARTSAPRRLRVGYLSGEYRSTPAYYFYRPFLSHHDRSAVEVSLYCTNTSRDHVTPAYMRWAEHWRDYAHLDEAALARAVRADELDVIVDLSGHFVDNRLHVMAERLAPVQLSFPNFPGTTGCTNMDYLLTDIWTSPVGSDHHYTERLRRLPCGYIKYAAPEDVPEATPLPMETNGYPTFGIFQRLLKFNDEVWDVVAAVLREVPDARLSIQNGDAELARPDSETARSIRRHMERRGIDVRRLILKGPLPLLDHLETVTQADVALDTFPYTGQTTTCESLWMGLPVVTLTRDTHVSRVSGGIITRVGHPEWVADSTERYVSIAASLVCDAARLSRTRRELRNRCVAQGLVDGPSLARELESTYHALTHASR